MKLVKFEVKKFKGIGNLKIDFSSSPNNNVYTLVGINESGKTTILEALNYYEYNDEKDLKELSNAMIPTKEDIISIKNRSNFNGEIEIRAIHKLEDKDKQELYAYIKKESNFIIKNDISQIETTQKYIYKNSKFIDMSSSWNLNIEGLPNNSRAKNLRKIESVNWQKAVDFLKKMMPKILYFPTTLFDLPDKIYLTNVSEMKYVFYKDVIQDILDSLDENLNIKEHLVDRLESGTTSDKDNVKQIALKMGKQLSNVILKEWSMVLGNKANQIDANIEKDEKGIYVEFVINDEDGFFKLSERSLGFRWFFVFLLLTQFRGFRKNENKQVIFLFDEPAANLSQKAQRQLLKSLERISDKCTIIYTTHSQHLINPNWLEGAYIVTNKALEDNDFENIVAHNTDIDVYRYREFVNMYPQKTSYFQPILDVLEYVPNELGMCDDAIFLEGKNDYYTLNYFFKVILGKNDLLLMPNMSCNNVDNLITLYTGWGKNYIVLLDSDKAGKDSKKRYLDMFGPLLENKIFTLKDVNKKWTKNNMENILPNKDKLIIQQICFPDSKRFSKSLYNKSLTHMNRALVFLEILIMSIQKLLPSNPTRMAAASFL